MKKLHERGRLSSVSLLLFRIHNLWVITNGFGFSVRSLLAILNFNDLIIDFSYFLD